MEAPANTPAIGGFQAVADALSTAERVITRQQVYAWHRRRDRNGFPDGMHQGNRWRFDLAACVAWYAQYVPSRGGRPQGNPRV